MVRCFRLILSILLAWLLSGAPAWAQANRALQFRAGPTVAEIETFVRSEWPYFSNRIRTEDALAVEPKRMVSMPHTLCALGYDGRFFECATLVVYQSPSGRPRSSLVRHDVERDDDGRLHTAIVISERPIPF